VRGVVARRAGGRPDDGILRGVPDGAVRVVRYGALAGGVVGLTASGLVSIVYLCFAFGRGPANPDGALAGALLLSGVVGFPGSLAVLALLERLPTPMPRLLLASVFVMPLFNWLGLGILTGLVADLGLWLDRRLRR
jgi:hypothetical protein